jgi:hypothetical protein
MGAAARVPSGSAAEIRLATAVRRSTFIARIYAFIYAFVEAKAL